MFFFFSSRRRHTRYWRDWSSDVCSSDLGDPRLDLADGKGVEPKAGHMTAPLRVDPAAVTGEHLVDLDGGHPPRHGQERRLPPRHLEPPPARTRRAPHLDVHLQIVPVAKVSTVSPPRETACDVLAPRSAPATRRRARCD